MITDRYDEYIVRRYGANDSSVTKAWRLLQVKSSSFIVQSSPVNFWETTISLYTVLTFQMNICSSVMVIQTSFKCH